MAPNGETIDRFSVEHTVAGLRTLVRRLLEAGVDDVAIERPDGPVVDALRQGGLTVYVIATNQLRNLHSRYGSAGNKDDQFDAYVLTDTLRTGRRRLRPMVPDTEQTVTLRMTCRARKDLVGHRLSMANQLRAHLQLVFPCAVGLFHDLDSAISLRFLAGFPSQDKAGTDLHAHLAAAPRGPDGPDGDTRHANPWSADLYNPAIARGHYHPHATHILARAWLHIVWKCWQTNTPYDPIRHDALQTLLTQQGHPNAA